MSDAAESDGGEVLDRQDRKKKGTGCMALVTRYALWKAGPYAIRDVMFAKSSGRYLAFCRFVRMRCLEGPWGRESRIGAEDD
jgi:hypothetical protein